MGPILPQVGTPNSGGCSSVIVGGSEDGKMVLGDSFMRAYFRHVHESIGSACTPCSYTPSVPALASCAPQPALALPWSRESGIAHLENLLDYRSPAT